MSDATAAGDLEGRLGEADIFKRLTPEECHAVMGTGALRAVEAGTVLAVHGDRGQELYTVIDGELRLLAGDGQDDITIRLAHPGETVPLAALIDPPVLVTTIQAAVDSRLFVMSRPRLVELFETHPRIGMKVFRASARILERRYSSTLDGLAGSLRSALEIAQSAAPPGAGPEAS